MISDTLSDARMSILGYMRDCPNIYDRVGPDLLILLEITDSARSWLDNPEPKGRLMNADLLRDLADQLDAVVA